MRYDSVPATFPLFKEKYLKAFKNVHKDLKETRIKLNTLLEKEEFLKNIIEFINTKPDYSKDFKLENDDDMIEKLVQSCASSPLEKTMEI